MTAGIETMVDLAGAAVIVTGASRGLGRACALALADAGADVVCAARARADLEETAAMVRRHGRRAVVHVTDVSRAEDVERLAERTLDEFGRIDVLVNNAGVLISKAAEEVTEDEWRRVLDTDLTGAFLCATAIGRHMIAGGGGRIVNIGSIFGELGARGVVAYAAAKGGVHALTRALAFEWARHNIRVNCIAPGYFATDISSEAVNSPLGARIRARIPLRRVAEPSEIGPLVVYLASAASSFMTGEVLRLDGGQTMSW